MSLAYESFRTVGSLLLINADFRRLVRDVTTVGRGIFADTASSVSEAAGKLSNEVEPSEQRKDTSKTSEADGRAEQGAPSTEELEDEVQEVAETTKKDIKIAGHGALQSVQENVSEDTKDTLLSRVKNIVENLRQRQDYSSSVSTISALVKRYGTIYSRAASSTLREVQDEVEVSPELNFAAKNVWTFLGSFGDRHEWEVLESKFQKLMQKSQEDVGSPDLINHIGEVVQKAFTDPNFFDEPEETREKLKQKYRATDTNIPSLEIEEFIQQFKKTLKTLSRDVSVRKLVAAWRRIGSDISTAYQDERSFLATDILNIFFPLMVRAIQHIPIPRLEISVPEMDLLLENVVIEPGHTFHNSSFLPYRILISALNNIEVRKTHSKETNTSIKNIVTATVNGLNVSAKEFGYWIRVHSPYFLPLNGDEGIASFALDQRGMDIALEFEVGRERLEQMLALRSVKVHIHKLEYTVRDSNWTFMWWILKPFLKHMVRRVLEKTIAEKIVAVSHVVNRELVFARERLRATRIADPDDLMTFIRAVTSRLSGKMDPDIYTRIGIDAHRKGVFDGVYAPGSLAKLWHEERRTAQENIEAGEPDENEVTTWRNTIFNLSSSRFT